MNIQMEERHRAECWGGAPVAVPCPLWTRHSPGTSVCPPAQQALHLGHLTEPSSPGRGRPPAASVSSPSPGHGGGPKAPGFPSGLPGGRPSPGRPSGVTLSEQNSFLSPMQFQGIYELTVMTWVKGQILEPKMLLVFLSLEKLQGFEELWAWRWGRANIYIFSIIS